MNDIGAPNSTSSQQLKFRIISCSSEESQYPVTQLLTQSPQSKGWQSARFCDYPQELTMQFMSPIRLKQIQFLSHQSKISSKIEIFVYLPDPLMPFSTNQIRYKQLGYLSLDSNQRTGFQARELKSVYVDSPCQYMKLVFHKHHINKYNLFSQVSLIALSCFGEILSTNPGKEFATKEIYNEIQFETQFDATTLDRLRALEAAKDRAVRDEDFAQAKRIQQAIDRLKQIGIQLRQLEERQIIAIREEDYDGARIIKSEIDRLRNAVAPDTLMGRNQQPGTNYQQNELPPVHQKSYGGAAPLESYQNTNYNTGGPGPSSTNGNNFRNEPVSQPTYNNAPTNRAPGGGGGGGGVGRGGDAYDDGIRENYPPSNKNIDERGDYQTIKERQNFNDIMAPHDEQVIPTIKNAKKTDPGLDPGGEGDSGGGLKDSQDFGSNNKGNAQAEPLTEDTKKMAEGLIPLIGQEACKMLFSRNWMVREQGLKWLDAEFQTPKRLQGQDDATCFLIGFQVANNLIGDKITQVSLGTMQMLRSLSQTQTKASIQLQGQLLSYYETVMGVLLEKLGQFMNKKDKNDRRIWEGKSRKDSQVTLFAMGANPTIGNATIVQSIARGTSLKPKFQTNPKHIEARLKTLTQFIQKYKVGNQDVPLSLVMEYALKQITNPSAEVREASIQMIVEVYLVIGEEKIKPHLVGVPVQQLEVLEAEFYRVTGRDPELLKKSFVSNQSSVVVTNIQPHGPSGGGGGGGGKPGGQAGNKKKAQLDDSLQEKVIRKNKKQLEEEESKICQFCGKIDQEFLDSNQLDIHLWQECSMLQPCPYCAQVVEIPSLASHFLQECDHRKSFAQCPHCQEPIHSSQYDQHTSQKACNPAKPLSIANRCLLCHQDIQPGDPGWKHHLVNEGCPNNQQTVG